MNYQDQSAGVAPDTLEQTVSQMLSEILGVNEVQSSDNVLLLGGESLAATQIAARIRDAFQVDVPIRSILIGTVSEVAAEIRALQSA